MALDHRPMENVSNIVNGILDSRGWRRKVLEQMAVDLWPEVAGEYIAQHTIAERYRAGTLFIRARSPQWTQELHFHRARIITRLNGRLRQNIVQRIRCTVTPPRGIKVGALKPNWEDPTFPDLPPPPRHVRSQQDDAAAQHARTMVNQIEDAEMREVMERLIATVIRSREEPQAED
jgi:hypothetical protein